jgi:hypothetical protein
MYTQETPHGPIRSQLDPDRDAKTTPGKWDLSSLPEPAHQALDEQNHAMKAGEPAPTNGTAMPRRYEEMQIDPYLDGDSPESCWRYQI